MNGKNKAMPGMVLHGYNRSGRGYVSGHCPGRDWPPFELSPEGTINWIESLENILERTKQTRRDLAEGHTTKVWYIRKVYQRDDTPPEEFAKYISYAIIDQDRKIAGLLKEINMMRSKVTSWNPVPIPGLAYS